MKWLLLLLLKRLFFNLSTRVCVCACVHIPHTASTSLLLCTYTGWCHIKWRILKLNLPGSESSTTKEQLVTLEVNMHFTSCLSLLGSNKNTEGVCADCASQALFIHSAQSSTQQSQDSAVGQQRLMQMCRAGTATMQLVRMKANLGCWRWDSHMPIVWSASSSTYQAGKQIRLWQELKTTQHLKMD